MASVSPISPQLKTLHCPEPLRDLPGWLVWREEASKHPGAKPRKVPYYARGGRRGQHGSVDDRARLVTFEQAREAAVRTGASGVGLALMSEFGIVALDFDHCVDADGHVAEDVDRLLETTYAELSPSGTGVRAFMRGDLGNHKSHASRGWPWGFETFSSSGFVTLTGRVLDTTYLSAMEHSVCPVTPEVQALAAQRFKAADSAAPARDADDPLMTHEPQVGLSAAQIDELLAGLDPDMPYDQWVGVGMALHHETDGEGFEHWDAWSSAGSKYDGTEALVAKWQGFGRETGRPVTAKSLLRWASDAGVRLKPDATSAAAVLEAVENNSKEPAPAEGESSKPRSRFYVEPAELFSAGPEPQWLIKGLLPQAELAVVYGEPGSGKSFMALDLAMAVARGTEWRSKRVRQGRVIYVAAEGGGGFRKRLRAYAQQHAIGLAGMPFGVVSAAPNMLLKADAVELIKAIREAADGEHVALVVLDTFAQVMPGGNENSGEDVGRALAHCKAIHAATGALVVLVHHSGKDVTKGARGWSGLRAAADVELEVRRLPSARLLRVAKQKDGDDQGEWGFDLAVLEVGQDSDGEAITSCAVIDAEVPVVEVAARGARKVEKDSPRGYVEEVLAEWGLAQNKVAVSDLVDEVARRLQAKPDNATKMSSLRANAKRALTALAESADCCFFVDDDGFVNL